MNKQLGSATLNWKQLGLIPAWIAAGYIIALLVHRGDQPAPRPATLSVGAPAASDSKDEIAALRAEYDGRIAALTGELEAARSQKAVTTGAMKAPVAQTADERSKAIEEILQKSFAGMRQRDTERLLAAGFSQTRIDWIRNRIEELEVKRRQAEIERRQKGLPINPDMEMAYALDSDLDLRYDIGDDEYERYRRAEVRSVGIGVTEVLRGGVAESAGLKSGDEIVGYDGKRVFNTGELDAMARREGKAGESLSIDVRRNGQTIRLAVPRGDLGIRSAAPILAPPRMPPNPPTAR